MKKHDLKKIKKTASGIFEFISVTSLLFILFLIVIDIGLYFRQVYVTQTASDETLALMQSEGVCDNNESFSLLISRVLRTYYNVSPNINVRKQGDILTAKDNKNKFVFQINCRNEKVPDKLIFSHYYEGLFLFPRGTGTVINAYPSNNIIYF